MSIPASTSKRIGPLTPLLRQSFSRLFVGQLMSSLGDQVFAVALPWTVLAATGDPIQVGLVLAAEAIPRVALLPIGGALADRITPRAVMVVADLGRAVVVAALAVTLLFGLPSLWIIALLAGLQGVGSGLFLPGSQAIVPRTVEDEEVSAANGLMQLILWLTLIVGPVLGGAAIAIQPALAFLLDAATFVISAITLLGVSLRPPRSTATSVGNKSDDTVLSPALHGSESAAATVEQLAPGAASTPESTPEPPSTLLTTSAGPLLGQITGAPVVTRAPITSAAATTRDDDLSGEHSSHREESAQAVDNEPSDETSPPGLNASGAGISWSLEAPSVTEAGVPDEGGNDADQTDDTSEESPQESASISTAERSGGFWGEIGAGLTYTLSQKLTRKWDGQERPASASAEAEDAELC